MAYRKIEQYDEEVTAALKGNYQHSLGLLGEDPDREGLLKTPERVAKAMQFLTQGYGMDAHAILNSAKFHEEVSEMILVKDIELYSLCEHHMLPFFRQGACRLYPQWLDHGFEQDCAGSGCLFPAASGAGAADHGDPARDKRDVAAIGSCGRH